MTMSLNQLSVRGLALLALAGSQVCFAGTPVNARWIVVCLSYGGGNRAYGLGHVDDGCDCVNVYNFRALEFCGEPSGELMDDPPGSVRDGYAPAFDRAELLGEPIVSAAGEPETRIVQGYYPVPDVYDGGSYSTRLFAIRQGVGGSPNQYAPIDLVVEGLQDAASNMFMIAVPGGERIRQPWDSELTDLVAEGDATLVLWTYRPCDLKNIMDMRMIPIEFDTLVFQDALPLPPACPGDSNRDGAVTFGDVVTTLANFGTMYPVGELPLGDANGDRKVIFADVADILANFGSTCP
jgi:hypothetical protein